MTWWSRFAKDTGLTWHIDRERDVVIIYSGRGFVEIEDFYQAHVYRDGEKFSITMDRNLRNEYEVYSFLEKHLQLGWFDIVQEWLDEEEIEHTLKDEHILEFDFRGYSWMTWDTGIHQSFDGELVHTYGRGEGYLGLASDLIPLKIIKGEINENQ